MPSGLVSPYMNRLTVVCFEHRRPPGACVLISRDPISIVFLGAVCATLVLFSPTSGRFSLRPLRFPPLLRVSRYVLLPCASAPPVADSSIPCFYSAG